jgi:hypothetical protein
MPSLTFDHTVIEMPAAEEMRFRALERLYVRREAVDELIRSLEGYEEATTRLAPCVPISARKKCS